jgi:hypothetical protein
MYVIGFGVFTLMLGQNNIRYDGAGWIHLAQESDQWSVQKSVSGFQKTMGTFYEFE